jgi:PhnB protein
MASKLNPYISFRDNAREAMEFYHSVFGGELTQSTFGEVPGMADEAEKDLIMHAQLEAPNGMTLMVADTPSSMEWSPGGNITVSLSGDDDAELRGYWEKLSGSGKVTVPLEQAPWGDSFGMCSDRFGVGWMVNIAGASQGAGDAAQG